LRTLGLNISGYIASAALVADADILAAGCEERYSRQKRDRGFPTRALRDALARSGLTSGDLDGVAVAWNPSRNLRRNLNLLWEANSSRGKYLTYVPNNLATALDVEPDDQTTQQILGLDVTYLDHHLAHAASAAFTSPWDHGAVVTVDAFGEEDTLTIGSWQGGTIRIAERVKFPHSVGSFYSFFTEFLGFQPDADEYKVMALGAYADPGEGARLLERVRTLYTLDVKDGRLRYELDLNRFEHYVFHRPRDYGPLAAAVGLPARPAGGELDGRHYALAWALQRSFEDTILTVLRHARVVTGERRVALAGGCFMNSVANGKLEVGDAPFDEVHIPPYPDDSGSAIGAALYVNLNGRGGHGFARHNFFGPAVDGEGAARALARRKLPSHRVADPAEAIARLVADGHMVGHAAGGMEFGQRALGNRSIFADPRDPKVRDKVNEHVKRREWFRPYAASILADHVHEVFEAPPGFQSLFMEKVRPVRQAWRERIPGLLHADGTVRVHTVDAATNPRLHAILLAFQRLTGVPLLLNTSFNVAGMPIVCTADDALDCFFGCGLDALVLDDRVVRKSAAVVQEPPA